MQQKKAGHKTGELNLPFSPNVRALLFLASIIFVPFILQAQNSKADMDLLLAAQNNNNSLLVKAIEDSANINATTSEGVSALMFTVDNNNEGMARYLIREGIDVNLVPDNGITALLAAVRANAFDLSELLIREGADVMAKDHELGRTALHFAVAAGYFEMCDMLLYYNVDPKIKDNNGLDALSLAVFTGNSELVALLLFNGADINTRDNSGNTPFLNACYLGYDQLAHALIDSGASLYATNNFNLNAMQLAAIQNQAMVINTLIELRMNPDSVNPETKPPLELCRDFNSIDARKELIKAGAKRFTGLRINQIDVPLFTTFNLNDGFIGGGIALLESWSDVSIFLNYARRTNPKSVLTKVSENEYTQYWEKQNFISLGVEKDLPIQQSSKGFWGSYLSFAGMVNFGGYSGSTANPNPGLHAVPGLGICYMTEYVSFKLGAEYFQFENNISSPYKIKLGTTIHIPYKVFKYEPVYPYWLNDYE